MPRLPRAAPLLALTFVTFAVACAATLPPAKPSPLLRPDCAVVPGQPTFCQGKGELFIIGLLAAQGLDRGDWFLLELPVEGVTPQATKAVAMAVVVEPYPDFAKVHVLYQREPKALDGALARKITRDQRARLGKFVGRIAAREGELLRIDLGKLDEVQPGDVYQILSPNDHTTPIGRVQVTRLADLVAWAVPLDVDPKEPLREALEAVYLRGPEAGDTSPVSILVVNFDPRDEQDADEGKASRSLAKDLGAALANAAGSGLKVRYEGAERVRGDRGEEEGHKEARAIGQKHGADIVVWGSVRCDKAACVQPRFTVVNEERLQSRGYKGAELWGEKDRGGWVLKGEAPEDPVALASAILGSVACEAERYGDASYYLGRALAKNVLRGEDEFLGRQRLAYVMYVRGQMLSAREQATKLIDRARLAHDESWEQRGHAELARIDKLEGKVGAARAGLEAMRRWAERHGDPNLSYVLHSLADLEAQQGRVEEARKLYNQSLDIKRRIGNVMGEADTLHQLAILEVQQGRVEEARKLYNQSLDIKRRIDDVEGEAATLAALAFLEGQQGRAEEARNLYNQSLDIERRIGNVEGEGRNLHQLAGLEAQQGHVEEARKFYNQSLDIERRIDDVEGEAATLHQLAILEAHQGHVEEARKLHNQSLDIERRIGNVAGEIASVASLAVMDYDAGRLDDARRGLEASLEKARAIRHVEYQAGLQDRLAQVDLDQGNLAAARQRWTEALALFQQLKMPGETQKVIHHLAALTAWESAAAAWKTHAALLAGGGVLVTGVQPGGQAEKAGLVLGDILVRYDQTRLDKPATLQAVAKSTDAARPVTVEVLRGAQKLTVQVHGGLLDVSIEELPPNPAAPRASR